MSAIRSWANNSRVELVWALFAAINLGVTVRLVEYETVPFHFVWVSLTLVYGWQMWRLGPTLATLGVVCALTAVTLGWDVVQGPQGPDELTEVPLMAAMFLAMVWHAERRRTAVAALKEAATREREFVNVASHQLKTPIAIARGLAQLVEAHPDAPTAREDVRDLIEELNRLAHSADQLLLFASAQMPGGLLRMPSDFEDIVVCAARRWSRSTDRRWIVDASDGVIDVDRDRLDTALDVLIENAIKATSGGDMISLRGYDDHGTAVIVLSDSGVGISAEGLPHVFEPFWSDPYDPEQRRGTGLGLSIAKAIVEAHGGHISLVSMANAGVIATVRLPGLETYGGTARDEPIEAMTAL
jgi:signal transduction histidine kinase